MACGHMMGDAVNAGVCALPLTPAAMRAGSRVTTGRHARQATGRASQISMRPSTDALISSLGAPFQVKIL